MILHHFYLWQWTHAQFASHFLPFCTCFLFQWLSAAVGKKVWIRNNRINYLVVMGRRVVSVIEAKIPDQNIIFFSPDPVSVVCLPPLLYSVSKPKLDYWTLRNKDHLKLLNFQDRPSCATLSQHYSKKLPGFWQLLEIWTTWANLYSLDTQVEISENIWICKHSCKSVAVINKPWRSQPFSAFGALSL